MRGPALLASVMRSQIPVVLAQVSRPRTAEEAAEGVRQQQRDYIDSLEQKITTLTEERDAALGQVERLERNVRVIGGTARNYAEDYPKLRLFLDLAARSAAGERL